MAERKAFLLRLDPKVYEALRFWSKDELRSLNGHIEFLLRKSLREAGRKLPPPDGPATT
ncbi:MAG: toxin-antitoxin system HicB family antitoxin [Planctomycetota bacterium]